MDDETKKELAKKLAPKNVKQHPFSGCDYIEGWHAIAEANRIFGFCAWTRETVELIENTTPTQNTKGNHVVSFRAKVRVTVREATREGTGFGSGIAKDIHDAYEGAIKEAETDAMKRALMTFGNQFGLALYDKKKTNVGVDLTPEQEAVKKFITDIKDGLSDAPTIEAVNKAISDNLAKIDRLSEAQIKHVNDHADNRRAFLSQQPMAAE